MTTRAITSAFNTGVKARQGYLACHCVELQFGARVRAKVGSNPPVPDTSISWTALGNQQQLLIQSSVDDGDTWQDCLVNGGPLQMHGSGNAGTGAAGSVDPVPMPIGATVTNKRVLLRQIFLNGAPGVVLLSLTISVGLETGEVITRTESIANGNWLVDTNGQLADLRSTMLGPLGIQSMPNRYMEFYGDLAGLVGDQPAHDANGNPINFHLSHGDLNIVLSQFGPEQQKDDANRFIKSAMSIEAWIYPTKTTGVLWSWVMSNPVNLVDQPGLTVELLQSTATSSFIHCDTIGFAADSELRTADNIIKMNQLSHVAVTYDGLWLQILVNGAVVAKGTIESTLVRASDFDVQGNLIGTTVTGIVCGTTGRFVVGRSATNSLNDAGGVSSYQGYMSELRLYHSALTTGAVVQRLHRKITAAGEIAAMVAQDQLRFLFPLDDGTGGFVTDLVSGMTMAWDQQQFHGVPSVIQLGWRSDSAVTWRGFQRSPTILIDGVDDRTTHPGRQSPPIAIDAVGDIIRLATTPYDITFPDGRLFKGIGGLGQIDPIKEPGDITPSEVALALSGLDPQNLSIALRADYIGRPGFIYLVLFDPTGHFVNDPALLFEGLMDTMDISVEATATCQLTLVSHLRDWARPGHQRWSDQGQRDAFENDLCFAFLDEMVDKIVWWPVRVSDANATPDTNTANPNP